MYWWSWDRPNKIPSGIATATTTIGAGTFCDQGKRSRSLGKPNRITRLTTPISAIAGLSSAKKLGIWPSSSRGVPWAFITPRLTGSCLAMMITPIAASIPWTAEVGKKSPRIPVRRTAKTTWSSPAATPTPSANA